MNLDFARSQFPALDGDWVYFDNGGGSQILQPVLNRLQDYLITSNVQLGASYGVSRRAASRLAEAQAAMAVLVNTNDPAEIVMGPSTSVLLRTLAASVGETISPGDEIVVTNADHEANVGPWLALERRGAVLRFWEADPTSGELRLEDLLPLLGPRTRLVSVTHASNILGTINPIRAIADRVHAEGALLCVDGVGYAPHRAVDVGELDVDFYAFSFYKTFGPHHAVLYGRKELLLDLPGQSLSFISEDDVPYKFQPGNVNYELSYSMLGLTDYLTALASGGVGVDALPVAVSRTAIERAFVLIAAHEEVLSRRLLDFLTDRPGVRLLGNVLPDQALRVPIISFVIDGMKSADVVREIDAHRIGIRFGNFHSPRLVRALGLDGDDGVVRVSMVHYNTVEEIDRLTALLDALV